MIFNKKNALASLLFSSVLLLAACGGDEQVTEPVNSDGQEQPADTENTSSEAGETFGFTEFDVNADFPDMDDMIEISYEEDLDKIEAEYKNKMTETNLSGNDAMDEIEPGLSQLELTPDTADDDVIAQVIDAFGIKEGFTEIEIEVKYPDGTEKEYKQTRN